MSALIYPKFIGRIGNNLFQIAACIGYAKKYGVKWGIKKGYVEPGFGVNQVDRFMPDLPMCGGSYRRYAEHQRGWDNEWFNYHEIPLFPEGVELCGFFQSEKYFENAKEEVRETFEKYVKWNDKYKGWISLHIRRGDYVQHSGSFPPIGKEYIQNAFKSLVDRGVYVRNVAVFSDDIEWCKENVAWWINGQDSIVTFVYPSSGDPWTGSTGRTEWDDFSDMASCDHHVIANSTFSWWAAWMGRNPNKVVITPSAETWFGPDGGVKHPVYDLIPEGWIQIHTR